MRYSKLMEEMRKIVESEGLEAKVSELTDEEIEEGLRVIRRCGILPHLDPYVLVGAMIGKGMAQRTLDYDAAQVRSQPGLFTGYPGKAKCWAYREDGRGICGRPAIGVDPVKGIAVCELHMPGRVQHSVGKNR